MSYNADKEEQRVNFNPLEIFKVIQQILYYLDIPALKSARLINSTWNHEANLLLGQRDVLLISQLKQFSHFNDAYLIQDKHEKAEGTQASIHIPYKSCIFGSDLLDVENPEFMGFHKGAQTFLETFGVHFTKVHFNLGNSNSSALRKLLVNMLFKWFPNLETLSLLLKEGPFDYFGGCDEIFSKFPKLKHLYLNYVGYNEKQGEDMLPLLSFLLKRCTNLERISGRKPKFTCLTTTSPNYTSVAGNPSQDISSSVISQQLLKYFAQNHQTQSDFHISENLAEIELEFRLKVEDLAILTHCINSGLKTIHLSLNVDVSQESFDQFLLKFGKSLEHVFCDMSFNSPKVHCKMNSLKNLWICSPSNFQFQSLTNFPALEFLCLTNLKEFPHFTSSQTLNLSLKCFKLHNFCNNEKIIPPFEFAKELNSAFPNISVLHLENVNNLLLQEIFANFPNLVSLHVSGKEISDEGLCGEKDKVLRVLLESALDIGESSSGESALRAWEFKPNSPCISDLNNLQYFSIKSDHITDASLIFGLSKCVKLKQLEVFSMLELITTAGLTSCKSLHDLEYLRIFVRNCGWISLNELHQILAEDFSKST